MKLYTLLCAVCALLLFAGCKKDENGTDKCKGTTCINGGTCVDGKCSCPAGYEGTDCGTLSRAKMLGTYIGYVKSTGQPDSTACTVTVAEQSDKIKVSISGLKLRTPLVENVPTTVCTVTGETSFRTDDDKTKYDIRATYTAPNKIHISFVEGASQFIHYFDGKK